MSLTSYRAAPSRANCRCSPSQRDTTPEGLTRFGSDLLSHALRRSTIGATALNGRVRDGTGCFACAMTTKPRKILGSSKSSHVVGVYDFGPSKISLPHPPYRGCRSLTFTGSNQAYRAISTGQLNALLHLHLQPIDVVVYHGSQGYLVLRGASRLDAFSGYPVRS